MRTIAQIAKMWAKAEETGFADLGSGLFLESGKAINEETVMEEKEMEGYRPLGDEKIYLTTDNAEVPEEICDEEMLMERMKEMRAVDTEGLELRYVVREIQRCDEFSEVLPATASEADARKAFEYRWDHLTAAERKVTVVELVRMACAESELTGEMTEEIDERRYRPIAEAMGWDWWGSYSTIERRGGEDA